MPGLVAAAAVLGNGSDHWLFSVSMNSGRAAFTANSAAKLFNVRHHHHQQRVSWKGQKKEEGMKERRTVTVAE